MSVTNISIDTKHLVLTRLLKKGEKFIDACSKSGLNIKAAKDYLAIKKLSI